MAGCYLYCILTGANSDNVQCSGLEDRKVDVLKFKDINVLYSTIEEKPLEYNLNNLMVHNHVSMKAMETGTTLPFQFGIVLKDEESIIELCKELYSKICKNSIMLSGKMEMGVKVFGNIPDTEYTDISDDPAIKRLAAMKEKSAAAAFLAQRVSKYNNESSKKRIKENLEEQLFKTLKTLSDKYVITPGKTEKLLINGSFLISPDKKNNFKDEVIKLKGNYPQYTIAESGPWPPYNFVNIGRDGEKDG